jgi:protein TonB
VNGVPIQPEEPPLAQEQGAVGTVAVQVDLSSTGAVVSASISSSSGNKLLDDAALQAAKQTSYAPQIKDCQKVAGSYLFRVRFTAQ